MFSRARTWFGRRARERDALLPLYRAAVAAARDPFWYRDGRVPDTVDGRFDMLAAVIAILLVRLEADESEEARRGSVMLTELFIANMDESLREIGIGDYVVGKHVGRMVGALGGRLGAFRQAARDRDYEAPVRRNIYHDAPPDEALVRRVAQRLERYDAALAAVAPADLLAGAVPAP